MLRAKRAGMRSAASALLLPLLLLAQGCSDDTLTVRGYLLPGSDATDVYVVGEPIRSPVEGDSFLVRGITGDVVELEFAEGDERRGRMTITDWSASPVVIRDILLDDEAHPGRLAGEAAARINGIRMAPEASLPAVVAVETVVLAAARQGDAFVARPRDAELPDLRVVITPGTVLEGSEAGELELRYGDMVRVEGAVESGYVVATRLVLRPEDTLGEEGQIPPTEVIEQAMPPADDERDAAGERVSGEDERDGVRSLVRPGGGRGRGRGIQRRD